METVEFGMSDAWNGYVATGEKREGLLGKLGMNMRAEVATLLARNVACYAFSRPWSDGLRSSPPADK